MKYSSSARRRLARFLGIMFAASLLAGPMSSIAVRAQATEPTPAAGAAPQPSGEEAAKREAWRATIARAPAPKKGCFTVSYPNTEWQEAPCGRPSPYPNRARGLRPNTVGFGSDYSAQVPGTIFSAAGSFPSVTPATIEESGPVWTQTNCPPTPPPPCVPGGDKPCIHPDTGGGGGGNWCTEVKENAFSLQLNSQFFPTAACQGGAALCQGWEQFVFSQDQCPDGAPCVFIEYWLLNYGPTSPTTPPSSCATPWMPGGSNDWFCNSPSARAPAISAAQLQETTLIGFAAADGDTVALTTAVGPGTATATAVDSMLNLAKAWNTVEWNVFGDCCDFEATFSLGSTLVVGTMVNGGVFPTCVQAGFTGETNNLFLVGTPARQAPAPTIAFTQNNAANRTPASCVIAAPGSPSCGLRGLPPCVGQQ
jgi:hypothetical protein